MNALSPDLILGLSFALAFIFALIGQKTHFCTMGAVADIVNMGDWNRMRMWLLAIGVAKLGAGSPELAGLIAHSRLALGVDTGLAHLAVALGVPTIAIYVSTNPALTGLYGTGFFRNLGTAGSAPSPNEALALIEQALR